MASRNGVLVSKTIYHIGVMTMLASLVWVGVGVYTLIAKPISINVDPDILEPINPTLNKEVLEMLSTREKVEINLVEPTVASESAQPSENVSIEQGGTQ